MRWLTSLLSLLGLLVVVTQSGTAPVSAQAKALAEDLADESDRGFLTGLLESSLGGEGRTVRIDGFEGALSRRATITQITVADAQGVWLSMRDIAMEWNRAALLRGRIEVTSLRAAEIVLERPALPPEDGLPAPEAQGFSLPDLPVGLQIDGVEAERIVLGAPVLGEPAEMSLTATARLDAGSADVDLVAERIDGATGRFVVDASYDASDEGVVLALDLSEAKDGIIARLLDIRGRPSLRLIVSGEGPLNNLTTDIQLQTAGQDRLAGAVTLIGRNTGTDGSVARNFELDLSGDLAPLFPEKYGAFFGDQVELQAAGARSADGALEVSNLEMRSGASELRGALSLSADRLPKTAALQGVIASEDGEPLLLPISGGETRLTQATINLGYDAEISEDWTASLRVTGLSNAQFLAETINLTGTGVLRSQTDLAGKLSFDASGLRFETDAIQTAVGNAVSGRLDLFRSEGEDLQLQNIEITGTDYALTGTMAVSGLDGDFSTEIDVSLQAQDLQRFGPLTGTDLTGQAELAVEGTADLGGQFNLTLDGTAKELGLGIARIDPLLAGETDLNVAAIRDTEGTRLPAVRLENDQLEFSGEVTLATDASVAKFDLALFDGTLVDPALKGPLKMDGAATQNPEGWSIATRASGPYDATATVHGQVTGSNPTLKFDATLPDIQKITPAYSGAVRVFGKAKLEDESWHVETKFEGPYASNGSVSGRVTGASSPDIQFDLNLPDINAIAPGYRGALNIAGTAKESPDGIKIVTSLQGPYGATGAVTGLVTGSAPQVRYILRLPDVATVGSPISGRLVLDGTATGDSGTWRIDTNVTGPGGTSLRVAGSVQGRSTLDLTAVGSAPLGLANPFLRPRNLQGQVAIDLALRGRPALSSLSGTITTSGASLSAPNIQTSLTGINGRVTLANDRANIELAGNVSSGGQISTSGSVVLTGALSSDLAVQLRAVRLVDPNLYSTTLNGDLALRGPLRGGALIAGQIDVGETQIQIPASQSPGFTIIPQITHVNAPPGVRQTLRRAGLDAASRKGASNTRADFGLDIRVNAPARVFVRGRGLDAELGGSVRLRGSTNRIISAGGFELIRGRLDILGKRFVLDQGRVDFLGQIDPFIRFVATTNTDAGTASIIIEGPASQPDVRFTSSPESPQDEVLAQIFFGRSITQLSAFQALQLASAVASLAGGGGDTILSTLRKGFGFDDLDVTTDESGNTGLRVGKYLSDNVYTDVTVGEEDSTGVSINVDLTPNLTARGSVSSDGNSSLGIFFERDY